MMKYPKQESIDALKEEIIRARNKHPSNAHLLAALTEEVGELNKAYLEGDYEHAKTEAIQVACVALRILEEGDSDYQKIEENYDEWAKELSKYRHTLFAVYKNHWIHFLVRRKNECQIFEISFNKESIGLEELVYTVNNRIKGDNIRWEHNYSNDLASSNLKILWKRNKNSPFDLSEEINNYIKKDSRYSTYDFKDDYLRINKKDKNDYDCETIIDIPIKNRTDDTIFDEVVYKYNETKLSDKIIKYVKEFQPVSLSKLTSFFKDQNYLEKDINDVIQKLTDTEHSPKLLFNIAMNLILNEENFDLEKEIKNHLKEFRNFVLIRKDINSDNELIAISWEQPSSVKGFIQNCQRFYFKNKIQQTDKDIFKPLMGIE